MTKKQNDLYINILAFGRKNIGKPIKYSDIRKHLDSIGCDYDEFALRQFFCELFIDRASPEGNDPSRMPPQVGEFFLESQGYFHLLEYEELKEARASSLTATRFAIIAIVISICSPLLSILMPSRPVTIESTQIEKLDNRELKVQLDDIKATQDHIYDLLNNEPNDI